MRHIILALLLPLALSACVAGKQEYQSYLAAQEARDRQEAVQQQARHQRFAAMAEACNGDPTCIREIAREATLSDAFASVAAGAGGRGQIQQFHVQAHPATAALTSIASVAVPQAIQGGVSIRQSDNSARVAISANELQASTQQAAFGLGIAAVNGATGAVTGIAGILPGLAPSINAAGSVYQGPTQIHNGDAVGRDNVRDGSQVGHSGPINTGTQNHGGVIGSGQVGNGRQNSPGPFTDNNNGPRCEEGAQCLQTPLPEPEGE